MGQNNAVRHFCFAQNLFIILMLFLFSNSGFSADEIGEPFIQNFSGNDYKSANQIWSVFQDKRGVMYFGSDGGIVEFDGTNWQSLSVSNHSVVRSLASDAGGTIYVGANGDLGVLGCDKDGKLAYHSLKPKIPKKHQNFKDVWLTLPTSHGIYFIFMHKILRWHDSRFELVYEDQSSILWGCVVNDTVFVFSNSRGKPMGEVLVLSNGKIRPLPQCRIPMSGNGSIRNIIPYPDNKLLICTVYGFYLYDIGKVSLSRLFSEENYASQIPKSVLYKFPTKIDKYLKHNSLFRSVRINNYQYAVGTLKGGIVIIDFRSADFYIINKERGLIDDCIWSLYLDESQNLWAGTENGISYIEISSPVTKFTSLSGIDSAVHTITRHQGTLYAGMTQKGAYYLPEYRLKMSKDSHVFKPVENYQGQYCLDFLSVDDHLLAASNSVNDIVNKKARIIEKTSLAFCISQSKLFPDYIFMGLTQHRKGGVEYIRKKDFIYEGKLSGIKQSIASITNDSQGNLWLSSMYNGIYYIKFKSSNIKDFEISHYTTAHGLPRNDSNRVFIMNNQVIVTTPKGIYKGTQTKDELSGQLTFHFIPENTFGKMFNEKSISISRIIEYGKDCLFVNTGIGSGFLFRRDNGSYLWENRPFKTIEGIEYGQYVDHDMVLWIPTSKGLFRFSPKVKKNYEVAYHTLIRRVRAGKNNELVKSTLYDEKSKHGELYTSFSRVQPRALQPTLAYKQNTLVFEYSASFYEQRQNNSFKYFLSGFDSSWSEWSKDTKTKYTNIPEGSYCFKVKAKNIYDHQGSVAEYKFTIKPPWHRTIYAYAGYVLIFVLAVMGGVRLNTRRLLAIKKKLEKIVEERTAEVVEQKDEIGKQKDEIETAYDDLYTTNRQLTETKNALWGEMELAKKIQTALLPEEPKIPGYEIAGYMKPADEVGGDYYDVISVNGKDWIVIGDVSGHGVPAGLIMMMVRTCINLALDEHADWTPKKILTWINRTIYESIKKLGEDKYMTITVFSCIENGKLFFSGLHQDILVYRSNEKDVERVETKGMWIGLMDEIGDMLEVDQLSLNPGDVMFLSTDGITEAMDKDNKMYSDEKLLKKFKEHGHLPPVEIKNGILKSLEGYICKDDVTMMVLKKL